MSKLNRLQIAGFVFFVLQILEWCAALSMAESISSVSLWCLIIGIALFIYGTFRKAPISPAIPAKSVSASKALSQSKVAKYETFYTCPACGSLVPKGTYTCDCGFVFRKRHDWRKIEIRISVCLVIVAALIGCSYASFRYGQSTVSRDRETYAQQRVDSIIKEIFSGQTDPFSGNPVDSEASYRAYLKEFNAYKAAQ